MGYQKGLLTYPELFILYIFIYEMFPEYSTVLFVADATLPCWQKTLAVYENCYRWSENTPPPKKKTPLHSITIVYYNTFLGIIDAKLCWKPHTVLMTLKHKCQKLQLFFVKLSTPRTKDHCIKFIAHYFHIWHMELSFGAIHICIF